MCVVHGLSGHVDGHPWGAGHTLEWEEFLVGAICGIALQRGHINGFCPATFSPTLGGARLIA
jgi:hypothetical protein